MSKVFRAKSDQGWTKETVWEQLATFDDDGEEIKPAFNADAIPDDVIQEWVETEFQLRDEFLCEETYSEEINRLNRELIRKVSACK